MQSTLNAPAVQASPSVLGADLAVTLADGRSVPHINLDYAATAPCLSAAATAVNELLPWYASVHRGAGAASRRCTRAYEQARETIADFIDARPDDYVVFTRNTTDAMNLLARALPPDATVIVWEGEHHANLLPWPKVARLPIPSDIDTALIDLASTLARIDGPVLVSVTGASNVTGEVWPIEAIAELAHGFGARVALDAAQLAPHRPVSLTRSNVDYLALSGHKLYAPFGIGILAGRSDWLDVAEPYLAGGGATEHVRDGGLDVDWHVGPARHEAGTPNLLGTVALAAACAAIAGADRQVLDAHERDLLNQLRSGLAAMGDVVELRTFDADHDRVGIVSFAVAGIAAADVSAHLASRYGIGVRDGLFCAHPFTNRLLADAQVRAGTPLSTNAVRASIGIGTTAAQIDTFLDAMRTLPR